VDEFCLRLDTVHFPEHLIFHIFSDYNIKFVENFCRHLRIMVPPVILACCQLGPSIGSITPLFLYVGDDVLVRNSCYKLILEESIYDALL